MKTLVLLHYLKYWEFFCVKSYMKDIKKTRYMLCKPSLTDTHIDEGMLSLSAPFLALHVSFFVFFVFV